MLAPDDECANGAVDTQQRYDQESPESRADDDVEDRCIGIVLNVGNLDRDALLYRLADRRLANVDMTILDLGDDCLVHAIGCAQVEFLRDVIEHIDCSRLGTGELCGVGDDSIQDSFQVHGRIYRLADLAKRPQLFDRLAKLARSCLNLVE